MAIVSSTHEVEAVAQLDGRFNVVERHTDSEGVVHEFRYRKTAAMDAASIRDARAVTLAAALAEQEINGLLNG